MDGDALKELRKSCGYSRDELSNEFSYEYVSEYEIKNWENSFSEPTYAQLKELAEIFDMETEELAEEIGYEGGDSTTAYSSDGGGIGTFVGGVAVGALGGWLVGRARREEEPDVTVDISSNEDEEQTSSKGGMLSTLIVLVVILLALAAYFHFGFAHYEAQVTPPLTSREARGLEYERVEQLFEDAGFENVLLSPQADLKLGLLKKDGEVETVTVNGSDKYKRDDRFDRDAFVRIVYHTFPE